MSKRVAVTCAHCGREVAKEVSAVNRAQRAGLRLFCSRRCFGLDRRVSRSRTEWKRMKAEYDRKRRALLADKLRAEKAEYHRRTYDPARAREQRKHRRFDHTAYCRRYYADPVRKIGKMRYDADRRANAYADYAESYRLLVELEQEICKLVPDRYERQKARGYFDRINERKRYDRQGRRTA